MAREIKVSIGDSAPSFNLESSTGDAVSRESFSGKWLVLYFYPKDNTSGCTTEAVDFTEHLSAFAALEAEVVGVSPDSTQSHCNFIEKHALKVTLLSDPDKKALEAYDAWAPKKMYGREFLGVIRSTFLIDPKGVVRAVWPKVKVSGHVEDVLATLKDLRR